jgi:hypothetical protein
MILIAICHATPATYTSHDKQTRFSKQNKDKKKQNESIPDSNLNLAKLMTHDNQTKEMIIWFLTFYNRTLQVGTILHIGLQNCQVPLVQKHTM